MSGVRERGLSGSAVRVRERMCREERGCGSTERGRERGREGTREGGRERGREREGASSRERVRGCECLSSLLGASSSAWTPKIPLPQRTRIAAVSCSEYASMGVGNKKKTCGSCEEHVSTHRTGQLKGGGTYPHFSRGCLQSIGSWHWEASLFRPLLAVRREDSAEEAIANGLKLPHDVYRAAQEVGEARG